jgi:hypothetical protein
MPTITYNLVSSVAVEKNHHVLILNFLFILNDVDVDMCIVPI